MSVDLYTVLGAEAIKYLDASARVSKIWRARIFMRTGKPQHNIYLNCKVRVHKMRRSDPSYTELIQSKLWDDMRSSTTQYQFGWDHVISCSIASKMPSTLVKQWVLNSMENNLSGVLGSSHEYLYAFAGYYIKEAFRPLVGGKALLIRYFNLSNKI
jgi:hypothetical protein